MEEATPTYEYDPRADALVIRLRPDRDIARTIEIDDSRMVDVDEAGEVVEIELLWASTSVKVDDLIERFALDDFRRFLEETSSASFQPRSFA